MPDNIPLEEQIAQVCHEANRAYCATLGDTAHLPWNLAPRWQKESAVNGVQLHLAALKAGRRLGPEVSHEKWLEEKRAQGWAYGPTKDPEKKLHPCFVPYRELPMTDRMKDYIFGAIVQAFFEGGMESVSTSASITGVG